MNHFQLNYIERLRLWNDLKQEIKSLSIADKSKIVDEWWQKAPLIKYYLHPMDISNFPSPWELLYENNYCVLARALGMCYTLALVNVYDSRIVEATDVYGEDTYIVLVDNGKYILNYHPQSVLSTSLDDFKIKKEIDISNLLTKMK
jgi:hypothetical protein